MRCIAAVNAGLFVSGADEKVIRAFAAPANFVETINVLSQIELPHVTTAAPLGATVPALGLSNKVYLCSPTHLDLIHCA